MDGAGLVAHLAGVAEDTARNAFFPGAAEAWRDTALASEREPWTAGHVAASAAGTAAPCSGSSTMRGSGSSPRCGGLDGPRRTLPAPVADMSVHLQDLPEALGLAVTDAAASTRSASRSTAPGWGTCSSRAGCPRCA